MCLLPPLNFLSSSSLVYIGCKAKRQKMTSLTTCTGLITVPKNRFRSPFRATLLFLPNLLVTSFLTFKLRVRSCSGFEDLVCDFYMPIAKFLNTNSNADSSKHKLVISMTSAMIIQYLAFDAALWQEDNYATIQQQQCWKYFGLLVTSTDLILTLHAMSVKWPKMMEYIHFL